MIHDVVEKSWDMPKIQMSDSVAFCFNELRTFMFANVYTNRAAKSEEGKAKRVVEELYYYYYKYNDLLPEEFLKYRESDGRDVVTADYIACMTDNYAVNEFKRLFVPIAFE